MEDAAIFDALFVGTLAYGGDLGQDTDTASGEAEQAVDLPEAVGILLVCSWCGDNFGGIVLTTSERPDNVQIADS